MPTEPEIWTDDRIESLINMIILSEGGKELIESGTLQRMRDEVGQSLLRVTDDAIDTIKRLSGN